MAQLSIPEHIAATLPDRQISGTVGGQEAQRHHQGPRSAAMPGTRPGHGEYLCHSFASEISGASGRFMPTT